MKYSSKQRNPLIASVFYNRGLIERWGRGTQKIIEECVKVGLPEPDFFEQNGSFCVRFTTNECLKKPVLLVRQKEILNILKKSKELSLRDIISKMDNPPSSVSVRGDLYYLKSLNLIELKGFGRGAVWLFVNR